MASCSVWPTCLEVTTPISMRISPRKPPFSFLRLRAVSRWDSLISPASSSRWPSIPIRAADEPEVFLIQDPSETQRSRTTESVAPYCLEKRRLIPADELTAGLEARDRTIYSLFPALLPVFS